MEHMLDQGTKDYFNEKFDNTNEKLDTVISTVEKIDGKVVEHGLRLSLVEKAHDDHIKNHKDKEGRQRFQYEQLIGFAFVVAAILVDKFI
jgi:hypothetical protein